MLATYLTYENAIMALPWALNSISITAAYCLANSKVVVGRLVALCGAVGWASYGLLIGEVRFFFANLFFFYIYASAVYKFNRKRDQYKVNLAQSEKENTELRAKLEQYESNANRELARRQKNVLKLVSRARADLDELEKAANLHLAPLQLIPVEQVTVTSDNKEPTGDKEPSCPISPGDVKS